MRPPFPLEHVVLDLLPDMVCVVDSESRVRYANPALERVLGYPPSQMVGRRMLDLLHPEDQAATLRQVDQIMAGHHQRHFRNRYRHSDGHYVDIQWSARWHPEHGVRIAVGREVTELRQAERALEHQAGHDPMTGLPNRRRLLQELHQAVEQAQSCGTGLAVLFVDMDGFKAVNDRCGHALGDQLLGDISRRLAAAVRPGDTAARVGGDEFVVVLPGCADRAQARQRAGAIRAALVEPYLLPGEHVCLDASIGVAVFPADGSDPAALLAAADQDMYAIKRAARAARA